MKYRGILGMLLSLIACGTNDPPSTGTGGSGGQVGTTGGSSTTGGVAPGAGGTQTTSGGTSTTSGGTTSTAGTGQGQGGSAKGGSGGTSSANGGSPAAGSGSGGGPTAGQGGAPPAGGSGGTGGGGTAGPASVLERNGSPGREGTWTQPTLTKAAAAKMALEKGFAATFKGSMYASPLYTEKGPGGKGVFIAVSADNVVAALDETTGAEVWSKTLGAAASQGCFGSDPVGILSTPVIDEKAGTVYVAAAIGGGGGKGVSRHEIHALSLSDGAPKTGWPVNVNGMKSGSATFASQYQNQRSALSLVNGTVYVGYGGFIGDCNDYRGWIVAVDAADPSKTGAWATLGSKGDAIWAAGGFASDGTSIFPSTGNNTASASARSATDSEAVLKINGLAKFERNDMNQFYPAAWQSMDKADADLGGSNTTLINLPGSTPEKMLAILGKDGKLFLLNPANLGGSEGQIAVVEAASVTMPAAGVKTVPTVYTTAMGTYIAISLASGAICPGGMQTSGQTVMGIRLTGGATPKGTVAWCVQQTGTNTAPISTTTDGKSDPIVWYVTGNQLRGVDGDTGATVFMGGESCTGVQRWTSPIAVKGRIVVGANGKLCSWKPQ